MSKWFSVISIFRCKGIVTTEGQRIGCKYVHYFNLLYTNGFFHLVVYNKVGMVHCT